jgi:hypothetical protein
MLVLKFVKGVSHPVVMEQEIDIPRSPPITPHKLGIIRRSLILVIPSQHALQANAHTFDIMHGTPSLLVEQIQTDDAVRVDVWVHGNLVCGVVNKYHLRRFDWVIIGEAEAEAEHLAGVDGVVLV